MNSIQEALYQEQRVVQSFVSVLKSKICELEDNPNLQRMGDGRFSIRSSCLDDNWTPFHHDHKAQYAQILKLVHQKTSVGSIVRLIEGILTTGSYSSSKREQYKFNQIVLNNLRRVWHDLDSEAERQKA